MTLTLEEMIEILEGIAQEGTNAAARIDLLLFAFEGKKTLLAPLG